MLQKAWDLVKRHRWKLLLAAGGTAAGVVYAGHRVYVHYREFEEELLRHMEELDKELTKEVSFRSLRTAEKRLRKSVKLQKSSSSSTTTDAATSAVGEGDSGSVSSPWNETSTAATFSVRPGVVSCCERNDTTTLSASPPSTQPACAGVYLSCAEKTKKKKLRERQHPVEEEKSQQQQQQHQHKRQSPHAGFVQHQSFFQNEDGEFSLYFFLQQQKLIDATVFLQVKNSGLRKKLNKFFFVRRYIGLLQDSTAARLLSPTERHTCFFLLEIEAFAKTLTTLYLLVLLHLLHRVQLNIIGRHHIISAGYSAEPTTTGPPRKTAAVALAAPAASVSVAPAALVSVARAPPPVSAALNNAAGSFEAASAAGVGGALLMERGPQYHEAWLSSRYQGSSAGHVQDASNPTERRRSRQLPPSQRLHSYHVKYIFLTSVRYFINSPCILSLIASHFRDTAARLLQGFTSEQVVTGLDLFFLLLQIVFNAHNAILLEAAAKKSATPVADVNLSPWSSRFSVTTNSSIIRTRRPSGGYTMQSKNIRPRRSSIERACLSRFEDEGVNTCNESRRNSRCPCSIRRRCGSRTCRYCTKSSSKSTNTFPSSNTSEAARGLAALLLPRGNDETLLQVCADAVRGSRSQTHICRAQEHGPLKAGYRDNVVRPGIVPCSARTSSSEVMPEGELLTALQQRHSRWRREIPESSACRRSSTEALAKGREEDENARSFSGNKKSDSLHFVGYLLEEARNYLESPAAAAAVFEGIGAAVWLLVQRLQRSLFKAGAAARTISAGDISTPTQTCVTSGITCSGAFDTSLNSPDVAAARGKNPSLVHVECATPATGADGVCADAVAAKTAAAALKISHGAPSSECTLGGKSLPGGVSSTASALQQTNKSSVSAATTFYAEGHTVTSVADASVPVASGRNRDSGGCLWVTSNQQQQHTTLPTTEAIMQKQQQRPSHEVTTPDLLQRNEAPREEVDRQIQKTYTLWGKHRVVRDTLVQTKGEILRCGQEPMYQQTKKHQLAQQAGKQNTKDLLLREKVEEYCEKGMEEWTFVFARCVSHLCMSYEWLLGVQRNAMSVSVAACGADICVDTMSTPPASKSRGDSGTGNKLFELLGTLPATENLSCAVFFPNSCDLIAPRQHVQLLLAALRHKGKRLRPTKGVQQLAAAAVRDVAPLLHHLFREAANHKSGKDHASVSKTLLSCQKAVLTEHRVRPFKNDRNLFNPDMQSESLFEQQQQRGHPQDNGAEYNAFFSQQHKQHEQPQQQHLDQAASEQEGESGKTFDSQNQQENVLMGYNHVRLQQQEAALERQKHIDLTAVQQRQHSHVSEEVKTPNCVEKEKHEHQHQQQLRCVLSQRSATPQHNSTPWFVGGSFNESEDWRFLQQQQQIQQRLQPVGSASQEQRHQKTPSLCAVKPQQQHHADHGVSLLQDPTCMQHKQQESVSPKGVVQGHARGRTYYEQQQQQLQSVCSELCHDDVDERSLNKHQRLQQPCVDSVRRNDFDQYMPARVEVQGSPVDTLNLCNGVLKASRQREKYRDASYYPKGPAETVEPCTTVAAEASMEDEYTVERNSEKGHTVCRDDFQKSTSPDKEAASAPTTDLTLAPDCEAAVVDVNAATRQAAQQHAVAAAMTALAGERTAKAAAKPEAPTESARGAGEEIASGAVTELLAREDADVSKPLGKTTAAAQGKVIGESAATTTQRNVVSISVTTEIREALGTTVMESA